LERLNLNMPVLVGHSDGASIALLHASVFAVSGLVLLAPHVFVESNTLAGIETAQRAFQDGSLERQLALFHFDPKTVFEGWSSVWLYYRFRDWNIEKCLVNIHCRALLLQGDRDEYGTLAQLDAIRQGICGVAVQHCLDDCGHSPHLEQTEQTLELVAEFINGLVEAPFV
jgi:pimeloyl-ACP methyl ester carboxylesterase